MEAALWVVIPAFNEETAIAAVVASVSALYPQIVVVDDGSVDGTAKAAVDAGAIVLRHAVNLGQGAALQTGISFALARGADLIATFDADGQHQAADLPGMVETLLRTKADVVLGSRFLGKAVGLMPSRRMLLRAAVLLTRITEGIRLTDAHNGVRVFTRPAAQRLQITQNRMAHASEIIQQIARHRLRYVEHPVTVVYTEYSKKKGQRLFDSLNVLADLIVGRLAR